jgi:hypothetical protein
MTIKTAVRQNLKGSNGNHSGYHKDGPQAYYMLRLNGEETWFTSAMEAISTWETLGSWAGAELWVKKTSDNSMRKIR